PMGVTSEPSTTASRPVAGGSSSKRPAGRPIRRTVPECRNSSSMMSPRACCFVRAFTTSRTHVYENLRRALDRGFHVDELLHADPDHLARLASRQHVERIAAVCVAKGLEAIIEILLIDAAGARTGVEAPAPVLLGAGYAFGARLVMLVR